MTLAEGPTGTSTLDLISTDYLWTVTLLAMIGSGLRLQVIFFIVGGVAQPITGGKPIARHWDGDLGAELNVPSCLATHDRPDVSLIETHDPVGDASAIRVIENCLLTTQLADHQRLWYQCFPAARRQPPHAVRASIQAGFRSRWPSCSLIALRILLMRGRCFSAMSINFCLAFLRCVRGLWPKESLT
jgi:hypothetical protein